MNLELMSGMVDGLGHPGLEACMDPAPGSAASASTICHGAGGEGEGRGMRAYEHRAIGDAATGAAPVNLGGEAADDRFLLSFGDVVALSGDFFRPDGCSIPDAEHWPLTSPDPGAAGRLFSLARVEGAVGTRLDTRDEIVCALKVSTVDEAVVDPRFEAGGPFAEFRWAKTGARATWRPCGSHPWWAPRE